MNSIVRKDKKFRAETQKVLSEISPKLKCTKGRYYAADTRQCYRKINKANIFYNPKQESWRGIKFQKQWLKDEMNFDLQKENINWNMFALFHEVGHMMTDKDWTNKRKEINNARAQYMLKEKDDPTYESYCRYFMLEDEKLATEWSINYIKNNKHKILELQKFV